MNQVIFHKHTNLVGEYLFKCRNEGVIFTKEMLETIRARFAAGHGSCPLSGTPDDVADEIERVAKAGFGGMTLAFVDYVGELEYFAAEVLPRLEKKGVRLPRPALETLS